MFNTKKEEFVKNSVEFVNFTHESYNECSGKLTISVDGKIFELGRCLQSGGSVWFDRDWNEHVEFGPWTVRESALPEEIAHLKKEIEKVVNDNLSPGCCGGCI